MAGAIIWAFRWENDAGIGPFTSDQFRYYLEDREAYDEWRNHAGCPYSMPTPANEFGWEAHADFRGEHGSRKYGFPSIPVERKIMAGWEDHLLDCGFVLMAYTVPIEQTLVSPNQVVFPRSCDNGEIVWCDEFNFSEDYLVCA